MITLFSVSYVKNIKSNTSINLALGWLLRSDGCYQSACYVKLFPVLICYNINGYDLLQKIR